MCYCELCLGHQRRVLSTQWWVHAFRLYIGYRLSVTSHNLSLVSDRLRNTILPAEVVLWLATKMLLPAQVIYRSQSEYQRIWEVPQWYPSDQTSWRQCHILYTIAMYIIIMIHIWLKFVRYFLPQLIQPSYLQAMKQIYESNAEFGFLFNTVGKIGQAYIYISIIDTCM